MKKAITMFIINLIICGGLFAAVGCTLNDPDRDIRRLFSKATNYKTEFITIKERGGEELLKEVQKKLGDKFEPVYESIDVPYAYYTVLHKKDIIGYVHGVNQKGRFGGMQLIIATNTEGVIKDFYYQKITSPEAKKFRDKDFTGIFKGLSLKEFYTTDIKEKIKDPSEKNAQDYHATIRGIKKNLILLDEFKLENKYDKYFYKDENKQNKENDNEKDND
jgi:hypothetical protein